MDNTHGWLYEMWYPENIDLVYPHRISYAWQQLPLLKVRTSYHSMVQAERRRLSTTQG
jgi:hypothetical protein